MASRCFPGGYNVKVYISRGRLAWWLLAFLHSDIFTVCNMMLCTLTDAIVFIMSHVYKGEVLYMDILCKILYMLYLCYIPLPKRSNMKEVSGFQSDNLPCYIAIHLVTIIVYMYINLGTSTHLSKIQSVASQSHVHTHWYINMNMMPLSSFLTAVYLFNFL